MKRICAVLLPAFVLAAVIFIRFSYAQNVTGPAVTAYGADYGSSEATNADIPTQLQTNDDGTISVFFQGMPGQLYQIQTSDGLDDWEIIASNVAVVADWTEWKDDQNAGEFYYRVVLQPDSTATTQATATGTSATAVTDATSQNVAPPTAQEINDGQQLLAAANNGDNQTVLNILRQYGTSQATLIVMATRLGQTPAVSLQEPFLKATSALSLNGRTNDVQKRLRIASSLGYGRPIWVVRGLSTNWTERCDREISQTGIAPIGALDASLNDTNFIRFFQWYDRYAERLHSVSLNWQQLNNHDVASSPQTSAWLNGLYKLIKARNPDVFVWLYVVKQDNDNEINWLQSLTFKPDGLFIGNLRQFHSPFEATRNKLAGIVGNDMPMVVVGFYGYRPEMKEAAKPLSAAKKIQDKNQRKAAKAAAMKPLKAIGQVIAPQLSNEEQNLKNLGYRGLAIDNAVMEAIGTNQPPK